MKKDYNKKVFYILSLFLLLIPFTVKAKSASPQGKNTTFYYNGSLQTFTSNYQELGGTYPLYLIRLTNMSADTISTEVSNVNGTYFSFGVRIWSTSIDNVGGFVQDLNGDLHICSMDSMSRSSVESSGTIVDVFFSCNLGSNYKIYSYGVNIGLQNNLQGYAISKLYYYDNRGDIENGEQDPMSQINNDLNGIKNSLNNVNTSINGVTSAIGSASSDIINNQNQNQQQTNEKLDDITNMDISDKDKEMPDSSSYDDYNSTEQELLNKTKDTDLSILDIGIDTKSSSWVWDTLTSLLKSHSAIFGMVIAILSIGIIKLVLGR